MPDIRIGRAKVAISGRFLRIAQVPEDQEDYVDVDDPEAVIAALKGLKPRPDIFCFWQRLPETQRKHCYLMEWDNVAAIRVNSYGEWLEKRVHSSVRTKLRKAKKLGVQVTKTEFNDALIQGLSEVFNETPVRQGRPFAHYGKTLDQIRSEWSVDLDISIFLGAYHEGELLGFMKLSFTPRYAELSGTICKLKHRDKSPMSALIAGAVQFCESQAIPYLTYGKFTYGKKGEDSLSDFKRYNGFQKVELPRYYVPLTLQGRLGLKFGLHRELSHFVPRPLLEHLLKLRSKYYSRSASV